MTFHCSDIFADSKSYAPSVVFIDEFQSLFSARAGLEQEGVYLMSQNMCI